MGEYFTIKYLQSKRYHSHLRLHEICEKAANSRDMRFFWCGKPFRHYIHLYQNAFQQQREFECCSYWKCKSQREFECCSYWKCKSFDWYIRSVPVCSLVESNSIYSQTKSRWIQVGTTLGCGTVSQYLLSLIEEHRKNNGRTIALIEELRKTHHFFISVY